MAGGLALPAFDRSILIAVIIFRVIDVGAICVRSSRGIPETVRDVIGLILGITWYKVIAWIFGVGLGKQYGGIHCAVVIGYCRGPLA
jgi:hypothetical protein